MHTKRRQCIISQQILVKIPGPETAGLLPAGPLWLWDECGGHIRAILAVPQELAAN